MSIVDLICRLVARIYFTFVRIICWVVGVVLRKRNVPKPENSLLLMSAKQAADRIRKREIKSIDLIEAYIARIEQVNGITNSVVENNFDEARQNAREVDTILDSIDEKGEAFNELMNAKPLLGVPFTVKDCIEVKGMHCTAGLVNRRDMVASEDADVVARMKNAGAILLAVTLVPEVCMWWESANRLHGQACNPYDTRRTVGGSSGGEAALVAAAGSVIGLGSDIGGSIRIPSYFNGVFGLKPSSGVVSLVGHVIETTGHPKKMLRIGPICRYAEDLPIILKVIVSDDKLESLQLNKSTDLKTLRVFYMNGISNCFVEPLGSECSNALKLAVEHFERKYDICAIRVDLPLVHNALDFYFTSMSVPGEPAMVHEMSGIKTDTDCAMEFIKLLFGKSEHMFATISQALIENHPMYSEDRKRMIMADRDRLRREVCDLLQDDGILLFPSFPTLAPFHNQPLLTPFNFLYTAIWNTLTLPVLQCPLGLSTDDPSNRLPTGVQVVGSPLSDHLLMAVAQDLEEAFGGWAVPQSVVVNE